ncbi:LacI family DNA-binding transcriptional regulator [Lactobacillus sp. CC-MHH1034]|uniref:LacI family DNA-binding transcriptional regulator n=1 Tax=Agrilactobacillus fermenti TaxID=2586909 RepID=UPI001E62F3E6|nr:LacI family DNA-binding transcriptional regulator [Agrilactobacillus fermenti]MCD2255127.1 LacI family DNA-binding transcriptional regulator [Agrilactobacillus fermenti]
MKPKLEDVARIAGVSPTTVSRVINNHGAISAKTRQAVQMAMDQLHYQPNSLARSLQGKATKLIGLIFYDISHPFFAELVSRLEGILFEKGYKTILCNSANNPDKERAYLKLLAANQVDGIIAGAHNEGIEEYQAYDLPIISFDRYLAAKIPIVSSDNAMGGRLAAEKLYLGGVRRPIIISGVETKKSPTNGRTTGFQAFFKQQAIDVQQYVIPFETTAQLRRERLANLLTTSVCDGVFCTDDLTAIQLHQVAQAHGIKVPDQLKIVGYDGTKFVRDYYPALTTVVQPLEEIANTLVALLQERIQDMKAPLKAQYQLPVVLHQGRTA